MSSKWYTWTKGDRRNAAEALRTGGVVPIPVECLTIKGMDYTRSTKGRRRKPIPLTLDPNGYAPPASRTSDSVALHDAAVQSATNLMAVMNDMLRSPQLSAHISQRHSDLTPAFTRPRSHTAPSTPLVEAASREPVELPGSTPSDLKNAPDVLPHGSSSSSNAAPSQPWSPEHIGVSIRRPNSSPPDKATATMPPCSALSAPDGKRLIRGIPMNWDGAARLHQQEHDRAGKAEEQKRAGQDKDAAECSAALRPKLSVFQPRRSISPIFPGSAASSHGGSSTFVPQRGPVPAPRDSTDADNTLLDEIARLRASQEAHVFSLKEAHEKELACQRSYISFLERRMPPAPTEVQRSQLGIDTSYSASQTDLHSQLSASTTKSFESCLEISKRASQNAMAEADALRRKLSLCKRAQLDGDELRRERDQLRDTAERNNRKVLQLKNIVRKAKENEQALRNKAIDLEARLLEANNERLDVLEGFHDACAQVRAVNERERRIAREVDEACESQPIHVPLTSGERPGSDSCRRSGKHARAASDVRVLTTSDRRVASIMQPSSEAAQMLASKDGRIRELECALSRATSSDQHSETWQEQMTDLQTQVEQQKAQLMTAQAAAERYNSLLHNELRRQTRHAARSTNDAAPQIEDEALLVASEKTARLERRNAVSQGPTPNAAESEPSNEGPSAVVDAATLEKELDHCIREIILYRLDIKGYRKDLKNARAEIDTLQATRIERPPTPGRDGVSSTRSQTSNCAVGLPTPEADHGLGILLHQAPKTPTKQTPASATVAKAPSLTSPLSPVSRPKTPLNTHKRLPKPPLPTQSASSTPAAPTPTCSERDLARTQTSRSLSESIISSYAKRGTVDSFGPVPAC